MVGKKDVIDPGTTLAKLLGETTAGLATTLAAGLTLFIVTKLATGLLKGVLTLIADRITLVHGVNVLMGAGVGFIAATLILCVILAVMALFPNEKITLYLMRTIFIGDLYVNNPLVAILGRFL